jgi:hypothetical protein
MALELVALCIDARDPVAQARFWAGLLDGDVVDDPVDGPSVLLDPVAGLRLRFPRTDAPKAVQNPRHFDLTSQSIQDQRAHVERAVALGATRIDIGQGADAVHVVLVDPEGNELCVIEPGNRFLDGCGLVGAVSCDGSHAVGLFWRDALGWPLVWDEGEETAIQSPLGGPKFSWGGPPLLPKQGTTRWRFDLVPTAGSDVESEVARLVALGAEGLGTDEYGVLIADPDGHEHRLLHTR